MNQNLRSIVEQVVRLVENGTGSTLEVEKLFLKSLDSIAFHMHDLVPEEPENFLLIPENDYESIRKFVESRFPNWGYYNIVNDVTSNIGRTEVKIGDAIDDVTDIIDDLKKVLWSYENEDEKVALWHLHDGYKNNWRWHLRHLQFYLYCLEMKL